MAQEGKGIRVVSVGHPRDRVLPMLKRYDGHRREAGFVGISIHFYVVKTSGSSKFVGIPSAFKSATYHRRCARCVRASDLWIMERLGFEHSIKLYPLYAIAKKMAVGIVLFPLVCDDWAKTLQMLQFQLSSSGYSLDSKIQKFFISKFLKSIGPA